jgi:hypothetical protein
MNIYQYQYIYIYININININIYIYIFIYLNIGNIGPLLDHMLTTEDTSEANKLCIRRQEAVRKEVGRCVPCFVACRHLVYGIHGPFSSMFYLFLNGYLCFKTTM